MANPRPTRRPTAGGASLAARLPVPWPILLLLVLAVAAAGYSVLVPAAHAVVHPHARPEAASARLQPPERYAGDPRIAQIYAQVAQIPQVIDGIYCYCHCSRHSEHYSLLDCFRDDHGANCDVCLQQAHTAFVMTREGRSLQEIRGEMDRQFGKGHTH